MRTHRTLHLSLLAVYGFRFSLAFSLAFSLIFSLIFSLGLSVPAGAQALTLLKTVDATAKTSGTGPVAAGQILSDGLVDQAGSTYSYQTTNGTVALTASGGSQSTALIAADLSAAMGSEREVITIRHAGLSQSNGTVNPALHFTNATNGINAQATISGNGTCSLFLIGYPNGGAALIGQSSANGTFTVGDTLQIVSEAIVSGGTTTVTDSIYDLTVNAADPILTTAPNAICTATGTTTATTIQTGSMGLTVNGGFCGISQVRFYGTGSASAALTASVTGLPLYSASPVTFTDPAASYTAGTKPLTSTNTGGASAYIVSQTVVDSTHVSARLGGGYNAGSLTVSDGLATVAIPVTAPAAGTSGITLTEDPAAAGFYFDPINPVTGLTYGDLVTISGPNGWRIGTYNVQALRPIGATGNTTGFSEVALWSSEGGFMLPSAQGVSQPGTWLKTTGNTAAQTPPALVALPPLVVYPLVTGAVSVGFYGDSITGIEKGTVAGTLVDHLYDRLHAAFPNASVTVANAGVGGLTTTTGLPTDTTTEATAGVLSTNAFNRAQAMFNAAGITTVSTCLGMNDANINSQASASTFQANLQTITSAFASGTPTLKANIVNDTPGLVPDSNVAWNASSVASILSFRVAARNLTGVSFGLWLDFPLANDGRYYGDGQPVHPASPVYPTTAAYGDTYGGIALSNLWCEPVIRSVLAQRVSASVSTAPLTLTATAGVNSEVLTWTPDSGATNGYEVDWKPSSVLPVAGQVKSVVAIVGTGVLTWTDTSAYRLSQNGRYNIVGLH